MLKKEEKENIAKDYQIHKSDTGSADVQIALLSETIKKLLEHSKSHSNDNHSKRGLLKMVIKRKKLLKFLEENNKRRYNAIIKKIGLKEKK